LGIVWAFLGLLFVMDHIRNIARREAPKNSHMEYNVPPFLGQQRMSVEWKRVEVGIEIDSSSVWKIHLSNTVLILSCHDRCWSAEVLRNLLKGILLKSLTSLIESNLKDGVRERFTKWDRVEPKDYSKKSDWRFVIQVGRTLITLVSMLSSKELVRHLHSNCST
jgi:hypothetical protein